MIMNDEKKVLNRGVGYPVTAGGGYRPRCPQVVPTGEPCNGLSMSLTASGMEENAIVGLLRTCTAGVCNRRTPAKGRARGEMPPHDRTREEEDMILRLRGGMAGTDSDPDDEGPSQLSVHEGLVVVKGTPLPDISFEPKVALERLIMKPPEGKSTRRKEERGAEDERERDRDREKRPSRRRILSETEEEGSSGPERTRSLERGRERASPNPTRDEEDEVREIAVILPAKRGRGRPKTTGDYANLAEEQARLNLAKEEELKLLYEEKIARLTSKDIVKASKIDIKKVAIEEGMNPLQDNINKIRELQAQVMRAAKASTNLKGIHQNLIQKSAGYTLGLIEALRNKMDRGRNPDDQKEIKVLREEQEKLRRTMEERLQGLEEALHRANTAVDAERRKAEHHLNLLIQANNEKEELHRKLIETKEAEARWWRTNPEDQRMEIAEEVPTESPPTYTTAEEGDEQKPPKGSFQRPKSLELTRPYDPRSKGRPK